MGGALVGGRHEPLCRGPARRARESQHARAVQHPGRSETRVPILQKFEPGASGQDEVGRGHAGQGLCRDKRTLGQTGGLSRTAPTTITDRPGLCFHFSLDHRFWFSPRLVSSSSPRFFPPYLYARHTVLIRRLIVAFGSNLQLPPCEQQFLKKKERTKK